MFGKKYKPLQLTSKMPFGKYKGKTLDYIRKFHYSYLEWLKENTSVNLAPEVLAPYNYKEELRKLPQPEALSKPKKLSEKEFLFLINWTTIKGVKCYPTAEDFEQGVEDV